MASAEAKLKHSWLDGEFFPITHEKLQSEALRDAISTIRNMLPMENTSLCTAQDTAAMAHGVRAAADSAGLERVQEAVKDQAILIGQLGASLKAATSELNSVVKKRKAVEQRQEEKKRTEVLKAESQKAADEKKKLQKQSLMDPFRLDFRSANLAMPISVFTSDDDFLAAKDKTNVYCHPFLLKGSHLLQKCHASKTISVTVASWAKLFHASKVCQQTTGSWPLLSLAEVQTMIAWRL